MSQSTTARSSSRSVLGDAVGVVAEAQTYKNLLYLFLAFPLGMAYFILLTVGLSFGLALSVVVVGLGIMLGTVVGMRFVASFERWLANTLLDTDIDDPSDVERSEGLVDTVKSYLQATSTWKGLGFVFLKFWVGIVAFVLLLVSLGFAIELLLLPLFPDGALNITVNSTEIASYFDTTGQRALAVPAGAVLFVVALNVLNAFARLNASIATSLLGPEQPTDGAQTDSHDA
jgi:hypothetical protein